MSGYYVDTEGRTVCNDCGTAPCSCALRADGAGDMKCTRCGLGCLVAHIENNGERTCRYCRSMDAKTAAALKDVVRQRLRAAEEFFTSMIAPLPLRMEAYWRDHSDELFALALEYEHGAGI